MLSGAFHVVLLWWDGVLHFTCKRQIIIHFVDVANFSSRCDCVLARFSGKVHLTIYSRKGRVRQSCQGGPFVEPWASARAFLPLNFSKRSLGGAGSSPSSTDWDSGLCLKDYMHTINPLCHSAEMSKLSMKLITSWECAAARNCSPWTDVPAQEILVCSPASPGPGLPIFMGEVTALQSQLHRARCVGHCSRQPLATRFHPCPTVRWVMQPSQPPLVTVALAGGSIVPQHWLCLSAVAVQGIWCYVYIYAYLSEKELPPEPHNSGAIWWH